MTGSLARRKSYFYYDQKSGLEDIAYAVDGATRTPFRL